MGQSPLGQSLPEKGYGTIFAMGTPEINLDAVQRERLTRQVVARWRVLTGGRTTSDRDRRTLVACSGGADSVACALMLAAGTGTRAAAGPGPGVEAGPASGIVLGHVVHDLRPAEETRADRDLVAELAARLGLGFVEASITVQDKPGNAEANAREARYRQLERLAWEAGCPFVAAAHHANDQVETMLMAMLRGAGVGGMAGMPPRRTLGDRGVVLVRPMLEVGRAEAERLCSLAGVAWATDSTNADTSRLRAGLRHGAVAAMERLRPGGMARAAATAARLREVAELVDDLAEALGRKAKRTGGETGREIKEGADSPPRPTSLGWSRAELAATHPVILAAALRSAYTELHQGKQADSLPARSVQQVTAAIREENRTERTFSWQGVEVVVGSQTVTLRRIADG